MQHGRCLWQGAHQHARAAGVIQVHVGQEHVVNLGGGEIIGRQGRQQARYGVVGAGVNEGGAAAAQRR